MKMKKNNKTDSKKGIGLDVFIKNNPISLVTKTKNSFIINNPWGDDSVEIVVPLKSELLKKLNEIYLPSRFTAIYHIASKKLEFIYTTLPIDKDEHRRAFTFNFLKKSYKCYFGKSSPTLLLIAEHFQEHAQSQTNYRNLDVYRKYSLSKKMTPEFLNNELKLKRSKPDELMRRVFRLMTDQNTAREPISFWVDDIEQNEELFSDIALHLNFYMRYFDEVTPSIEIHEEALPKTNPKAVRYLFDAFPNEISAVQIDPYLLKLYGAAIAAPDNFLAFLYYYQILEYAAFYYVNEDLSQKIAIILSAPETPMRVRKATSEIFDIMVDYKIEEYQKMEQIVWRCVNPDILWKIIEPNLGFFLVENVFEGGYQTKPFGKEGWKIEDFRSGWHPILITNLRNMRNAIAHAREKRTSSVVIPNSKNAMQLQPWLYVLKNIAQQILLHYPAPTGK
jgi:hypothetical protein